MTRNKILSSLAFAAVAAVPAIALADPPQGFNSGADPRPVAHDQAHRDWHAGDRLPASYGDQRYVVNDWQVHHLHKPAKGYHWVQVDNQFVLVSRKGGVISDVQINQ